MTLPEARRHAQRQRHDARELTPALGDERPGVALQLLARDGAQRRALLLIELEPGQIRRGVASEAAPRSGIRGERDEGLLKRGQHGFTLRAAAAATTIRPARR